MSPSGFPVMTFTMATPEPRFPSTPVVLTTALQAGLVLSWLSLPPGSRDVTFLDPRIPEQ